jgi:hypothetical protein
MALTPEMQAQIDYQEAMRAGDRAEEAKRIKLEALRMAKEIAVENRRTQSVAEATDITAADIEAVADSLISYVNS